MSTGISTNYFYSMSLKSFYSKRLHFFNVIYTKANLIAFFYIVDPLEARRLHLDLYFPSCPLINSGVPESIKSFSRKSASICWAAGKKVG